MCKFCGPESSSRWQDLFKKTPQFNEISPGQVNLAKYDSQKKINLYSLEFQTLTQNNPIEKIYFAGGEPLLASEHFPVLDILIQNRHSRQVYLSYNTNLSHSSALMQTWLEKLTHFKKVDIYCSIDGHEELTNYIRKGIVFSTFIKNIKLLKEFKEKHNGFFFNLDITMTSVFLLNLKAFSELVIQLQVPVDAKVMLGYEYKSLFLRCEFLPQELRKQLVTDWLKYFVQLSSANQYLLEKLRQNLILAQNLEEFSFDVQIKALKQARTHDRLFPEDPSFSSFFNHHEPAAKWLHSLPSESG